MKIASIHIHNFRSVIDESISLYGFNLFVGSNNAGKSSCLDALRHFFASSDQTTEADVPFKGRDETDDGTWVQVKFDSEDEAEKEILHAILPDGATAIRRRFGCGKGRSGGYCAVDDAGNVVKDDLKPPPALLPEGCLDIGHLLFFIVVGRLPVEVDQGR